MLLQTIEKTVLSFGFKLILQLWNCSQREVKKKWELLYRIKQLRSLVCYKKKKKTLMVNYSAEIQCRRTIMEHLYVQLADWGSGFSKEIRLCALTVGINKFKVLCSVLKFQTCSTSSLSVHRDDAAGQLSDPNCTGTCVRWHRTCCVDLWWVRNSDPAELQQQPR